MSTIEDKFSELREVLSQIIQLETIVKSNKYKLGTLEFSLSPAMKEIINAKTAKLKVLRNAICEELSKNESEKHGEKRQKTY